MPQTTLDHPNRLHAPMLSTRLHGETSDRPPRGGHSVSNRPPRGGHSVSNPRDDLSCEARIGKCIGYNRVLCAATIQSSSQKLQYERSPLAIFAPEIAKNLSQSHFAIGSRFQLSLRYGRTYMYNQTCSYERGTPATAVHEMESGERRTFEGTIGINKVMEWDRRYLPADE